MEKPYVVGIDIGGTNTVFGVVDARGTILYSGSMQHLLQMKHYSVVQKLMR